MVPQMSDQTKNDGAPKEKRNSTLPATNQDERPASVKQTITTREDRLAQALRQNLRRRKAGTPEAT